MLTRQFIEKLKLWHEPQYKVALRAGIHPGLLSKWVIGAQPARYGDQRIIKIAEILGFPKEKVFLTKGAK